MMKRKKYLLGAGLLCTHTGSIPSVCRTLPPFPRNVPSMHWMVWKSYWIPDMEVVDNASDENNENTRRKATVVPIKIEYV